MKYIKGFDTLRAISIAMVVTAHSLPNLWIQDHRIWYLISGDTGVLVFFVISGFLITTLLLKEKRMNGIINLKKFFARRFLRLLPPLVIFYLAILVLMTTGLIQETYIGLAISACYLYNFVPNKFYTAELGHTWSLALEEQFYFSWPFIISFIKEKRTLLVLGAFAILFSLLFLLFIYPIEFLGHFKAHRWFIPAISPIMIGAMLAIAKDQISEVISKNWLLVIGLVFFYTTPLYFPKELLMISPIFQSFGIAFLLLLILNNQGSTGVAVLNNSATSYIGKISYGIYVYQGLFLRTGPGSDQWFQQFPQNIILTLVCAILSFEFLEKYFLKKKKSYSVVN